MENASLIVSQGSALQWRDDDGQRHLGQVLPSIVKMVREESAEKIVAVAQRLQPESLALSRS